MLNETFLSEGIEPFDITAFHGLFTSTEETKLTRHALQRMKCNASFTFVSDALSSQDLRHPVLSYCSSINHRAKEGTTHPSFKIFSSRPSSNQ